MNITFWVKLKEETEYTKITLSSKGWNTFNEFFKQNSDLNFKVKTKEIIQKRK